MHSWGHLVQPPSTESSKRKSPHLAMWSRMGSHSRILLTHTTPSDTQSTTMMEPQLVALTGKKPYQAESGVGKLPSFTHGLQLPKLNLELSGKCMLDEPEVFMCRGHCCAFVGLKLWATKGVSYCKWVWFFREGIGHLADEKPPGERVWASVRAWVWLFWFNQLRPKGIALDESFSGLT